MCWFELVPYLRLQTTLKLINNLCLDELPDDGRVKETTNMKINCLLLIFINVMSV